MSEESYARAPAVLVDKPGGTGLGLALWNEIVDAHGGRLVLQRREGGGTVVSFTLPG